MPGGGEAPTLSAESANVAALARRSGTVNRGSRWRNDRQIVPAPRTGPMRKGNRRNSPLTSGQPSPPKSINSERIRYALAGLRYPAEQWQIVGWANDDGADTFTMDDLHNLPRRSYRDIRDVIDAVAVAVGLPRSA